MVILLIWRVAAFGKTILGNRTRFEKILPPKGEIRKSPKIPPINFPSHQSVLEHWRLSPFLWGGVIRTIKWGCVVVVFLKAQF